jgi:hypothetical protein
MLNAGTLDIFAALERNAKKIQRSGLMQLWKKGMSDGVADQPQTCVLHDPPPEELPAITKDDLHNSAVIHRFPGNSSLGDVPSLPNSQAGDVQFYRSYPIDCCTFCSRGS